MQTSRGEEQSLKTQGGESSALSAVLVQTLLDYIEEKERTEKVDSGAVKDLLKQWAKENSNMGDSQLGPQTELFREVGMLTRKLHSSLSEFCSELNPKLGQLVQTEMPDAAEKLESVMSMTGEAAHKVLGLVEQQSQALETQKGILERALTIDSKGELKPLLEEAKEHAETALELNMNILMAQEFQDLSGQILRKVIKLIGEVESGLVTLVKMFGLPSKEDAQSASQGGQAESQPSGSCDQLDIDDLLGSLGF